MIGSAEEGSTPKLEVGLNYSVVHATSRDDTRQLNSNGGSGYLVYNLNHTLGLVADLGGYRNGTVHGPFSDSTTFTYLFGPRFNWRRSRVTPYVQFLFGGARLPGDTTMDALASSDRNGFAMATGGGIDIAVTNHITIKPIQIEYVMTQIPSFAIDRNAAQNGLRYSAGVVFRFGEK